MVSNDLIDDRRSAFEAWAQEVNPLEYRRLLDRQPSGNYTNSTTTLLWTAWQAAWNHVENKWQSECPV